MTYSRFGNNNNRKNTFGFSRNSPFAGVKPMAQKDFIFDNELRNQIVKAQREETRREIIMSLAGA